jgi:hypothetical protein
MYQRHCAHKITKSKPCEKKHIFFLMFVLIIVIWKFKKQHYKKWLR